MNNIMKWRRREEAIERTIYNNQHTTLVRYNGGNMKGVGWMWDVGCGVGEGWDGRDGRVMNDKIPSTITRYTDPTAKW
jgi:hypothetical protein